MGSPDDRLPVPSLAWLDLLEPALRADARRDLQALTRLATTDSLTGVANRAHFTTVIERTGEQRRSADGLRGLVFVDVDGLKDTNDRFGHDAGDRLLTSVASRVAGAARPGDLVARLGGDEFAVLCDGLVDAGEGAEIAGRIRAAILLPYEGPGPCSASVGVAVAAGGGPAGDLLRAADRAMYREKRVHRRTWRDEASPTRMTIDLAEATVRALAVAPPPRGLTVLLRTAPSPEPFQVSVPESLLIRAVAVVLASSYQARPTAVELAVRRRDSSVELEVSDDGAPHRADLAVVSLALRPFGVAVGEHLGPAGVRRTLALPATPSPGGR